MVTGIDVRDVYPFINPAALFRGQWQVKKGALSDEAYEALLEDEITPVFEALKAKCAAEGILRPAVVYGYFPCVRDGDDLVIFDPADFQAGSRARGVLREIERFTSRGRRRRAAVHQRLLPTGGRGHADVIGIPAWWGRGRARRGAAVRANDYTNHLPARAGRGDGRGVGGVLAQADAAGTGDRG